MVVETAYYDVLGVKPGADISTIRSAYKKQALKFHPDKPTGDAEKVYFYHNNFLV